MKNLRKIFIVILLLISFNIVHAKSLTPEIIEGYNPLYYPEDESIYSPSLDYSDTTNITTSEKVKKAVVSARTGLVNRANLVTISVPTNLNRDKYPRKVLQSYYETVAKLAIDELMAHTGKGTEGDYLKWNYSYWKASGSYDNGENNTWTFTYRMSFTFRTTASQENELTKKLNKVYTDLGLNKKNTYEKVYAIHKYIVDNVTYDYKNLNNENYPLKFTAYAALMNKTSVCQGFALLFYRMSLDNNIDARLISGTAGGPHAWNIVKIDNYYYNLDSTWDAGQTKYNYFLKNNANFKDHIRDSEYNTSEFNKKYPMSPTNYTPIKLGDMNHNNSIDLTDVLMLLKTYFNNYSVKDYPAADLNRNNVIDLTDVLMLLKTYFAKS